ncbi:hypothetical protein HDR63_03215 [bacterium]|nr:hypothetical protein [bacterium]
MNLTIIDGHNLFFRALYRSPRTITTPSGTPVNAVCHFLTTFVRMVRRYPKNQVFVVFDSKTGADAKKAIFPNYKARNHKPPEGSFEQLGHIQKILDLMNVKWCEHPDYEGDDVIASLADYWIQQHLGRVYIFSDDFDFIQIMSHKIIPCLGGHGFQRLTPAAVYEKYGIQPRQFLDLCTLHPQKSSQPGSHRIPVDVVRDLLARFDTFKNIYRHLDEIAEPWADILRQRRPWLRTIRRFLTMNRHIPISEIADMPLPDVDMGLIRQPTTYYLKKLDL